MPVTVLLGITLLATSAEAPRFPVKLLAGDYFFGDGLGENCHLSLTSKGRFTFRATGCTGEYGRKQGSWRLDGDVVILRPEFRTAPGFGLRPPDLSRMGTRFIPIQWGPDFYLVDEYQVPAFAAEACRAVNGESDFSPTGTYDYLRYDRAPRPKEPLRAPVLPKRFEHFYNEGPVLAKVTKIDFDGTLHLRGTFEGRVGQGAIMTQIEWGPDIVLQSTQEMRATARLRPSKNPGRPPKVGDEFTTGDGNRRPAGTDD